MFSVSLSDKCQTKQLSGPATQSFTDLVNVVLGTATLEQDVQKCPATDSEKLGLLLLSRAVFRPVEGFKFCKLCFSEFNGLSFAAGSCCCV